LYQSVWFCFGHGSFLVELIQTKKGHRQKAVLTDSASSEPD